MDLRWLLVVFLAVSLAIPGPVGATEHTSCVGTMTAAPNGTTVISIQGARMAGEDRGKRAARVAAIGPEGGIEWVHHSGRDFDIVWSYDIDPISREELFVTATRPNQTVFYVLNTTTGAIHWRETLGLIDTHDADLIDDHRILIANMRNAHDDTNRDRLLLYNRTSEEREWEWLFADYYSPATGGNYSGDWTHVNDIDLVSEDRILASPRNLDQVIMVERDTGDILHRLGRDDNHQILRKQHNPMYLESADGNPTILVADSENNRIVEYEKQDDQWIQTWKLTGDFAWPRDADRLPNGNTLIADSRHHRVIEVTPDGEVVWEFYAPWLVYDVERMRLGDEPGGPTISDQNASGAYTLNKDARAVDTLSACASTLRDAPSPGNQGTNGLVGITATESPGQPGFGVLVAVLALGVWRLVTG